MGQDTKTDKDEDKVETAGRVPMLMLTSDEYTVMPQIHCHFFLWAEGVGAQLFK